MPTCPKCGTVADSGPEATYMIETRAGAHRVAVPAAWRPRVEKGSVNGETFALAFVDESGDEAARFNGVTIFCRNEAEVKDWFEPRAATRRAPGSILRPAGGSTGTGQHPTFGDGKP